ncbi:protein-glutamine gamma-glutamyltransferase [Scopulibacillus daqui]|uniref:Protein-glutamine gamma-glutamyltransferase n=1 Tax=Scopulibacillus daqui TaxID=1469162 RepID=A0ABS2Q426_9BACL|nr:protein-glutamine gamma-glutamyltransferase [Scopulibacillus daqui]MBM7646705.1 protein-glutamine gamma-glutamyltransferase [Scopulibacillus daqui]
MITLHHQPVSESQLSALPIDGQFSGTVLTELRNNPVVFNYRSLEELIFEVTLRNYIVVNALNLYESKASFATFYHSRCNERYWRLTNEGGFELKSGASSSQAINDIFQNGSLYAFECATAMVIILYKAMIDTISPSLFDQLYPDIYLWDWHRDSHFPIITETVDHYGIIGDIRYFKNPDVNPRTPQWQGENAIELPNGYYYGHGLGILRAEQMIEELNEFRRVGATRSAYLMPDANRPYFAYLFRYTRQRFSQPEPEPSSAV